jgi:hypothetical protein
MAKSLLCTFMLCACVFGETHAQAPTSTTVPARPLAPHTAADSGTISTLLDRIARAQEANVAQREAEKADDRPSRDLAAQEAMANWARLSFFATVVGILLSGGGLLALLYSLRLNRRATDAAHKAVAVAKETNEAQSRPWVSVSCALGKPNRSKTHAGVEGIYFNVVCQAKNHGRSPATGVSFHAEITLLTRNTLPAEELMAAYCDGIRARSEHDAEAIFPDATSTHQHSVFLPMADIEDDLRSKDFKMIAPVVYGCLNYQSPYTTGVRQTRFVYHLATTSDDGNALVLRPDQVDWLSRPILFMSPGTIVSD